jgi:hypothetical protein
VNVEPGRFGAVESELAPNDRCRWSRSAISCSRTKSDSKPPFPPVHALITDLDPATGGMVAASRETGAAERDDELVSFAL